MNYNAFIDYFCTRENIPRPVLFERTRKREIVELRMVAISILIENYDLPLTKIARIFKMHHASMIYAKKVVFELPTLKKKHKKYMAELEIKYNYSYEFSPLPLPIHGHQ